MVLSHIEDIPSHYLFIKNMLEGGLKQIAVLGTMHKALAVLDIQHPTQVGLTILLWRRLRVKIN